MAARKLPVVRHEIIGDVVTQVPPAIPAFLALPFKLAKGQWLRPVIWFDLHRFSFLPWFHVGKAIAHPWAGEKSIKSLYDRHQAAAYRPFVAFQL
jgi:hypothetical protein